MSVCPWIELLVNGGKHDIEGMCAFFVFYLLRFTIKIVQIVMHYIFPTLFLFSLPTCAGGQVFAHKEVASEKNPGLISGYVSSDWIPSLEKFKVWSHKISMDFHNDLNVRTNFVLSKEIFASAHNLTQSVAYFFVA